VLNAGRFAGLCAGNIAKRPKGFVAVVARNAHRRRTLKVKRHTMLERCYLLTFGLCVHSAPETKASFKVSWDLTRLFLRATTY
jgi:2-methylcitrate dehydratase PrpD